MGAGSDDFFSLVHQGDLALYTHDSGGPAWVGFAVALANAPQSLSLSDAWNNYHESQTSNGGCFLFCGSAPADPNTFIGLLQTALGQLDVSFGGYHRRAILWIDDPATALTIDPQGVARGGQYLAWWAQGQQMQSDRAAALGPGNVQVHLPISSVMTLGSESIQIQQRGLVSWYRDDFALAPVNTDVTIPLDGPTAGSLAFSCDLRVPTGDLPNDFDGLGVSVRYVASSTQGATVHQYSLFSPSQLATQATIPCDVALHTLHPTDADATLLSFRPPANGALPALPTTLRTQLGIPLTLTPVPQRCGLALTAQPGVNLTNGGVPYAAVPSGPYALGLDASAPPNTACVLAPGLSGVEGLSFTPARNGTQGDALWFHPGQDAHAPSFPPPDGPVEVGAAPPPALDGTFTTAWVSIEPAASPTAPVRYYSQPQGASLYSAGTGVGAAEPRVLGFYDTPAFVIGSSGGGHSYPLAPPAGFLPQSAPASEAALLQSSVLAPVRKQQVASARDPLAALSTGAAPVITTSPQGFIVSVLDGQWQSLSMARTTGTGGHELLALTGLPSAPSVQDAFQSNQLFLVATAPPWVTSGQGAQFADTVAIGDWEFRLGTGQDSTFGDYRNVVIFKFCHGTLSDRAVNPSSWTAPGDFNHTNNGELSAVAQWLQQYIATARAQNGTGPSSGLFDDFLQKVDDPNWTGILALNLELKPDELPAALQGLVAGIDVRNFTAHHVGIQVSFTTAAAGGSIQFSGDSSVFGLINYIDPAYAGALSRDADPLQPIAAAPNSTYDFRVLLLQVLFENSTQTDFVCRAQVTTNSWLGDQVTAAAQPEASLPGNSVVIVGTAQHHGSDVTYRFQSQRPARFTLGSPVLQAVEVDAVDFVTVRSVPPGAASGSVVSRFTFDGLFDFAEIQGMDLLSWGSTGASPVFGVGLPFAGATLTVSYDIATPAFRTFDFSITEVSLNAGAASPRTGSLASAFPLQVAGLTTGDAGSVQNAGFLPLSLRTVQAPKLPTPPTLTGLQGNWHGLVLNLNVGTLGALAADLGTPCALIVAWSPSGAAAHAGNSYPLAAGVQLPGASPGQDNLLSLQGVLRLSFGRLELACLQAATPVDTTFLLNFDQVALKVLVWKLPPSGSTKLSLFANPAGGAASALGWLAAYKEAAPVQALPAGGDGP